jgi:hypothetical protein
MSTIRAITLGIFAAWLLSAPAAAQTDADKERAELAKALAGAKVSLQQGLAASEREGRPISAKFEVEHGQLQLSVYTEKANKFSEVIVDHQTGKVAKTEAITKGEDLTAAKGQSAAMAKSKVSLRAAVDKALKANAGFRAVSEFPMLKDGHPVAEVTIVKGQEFKTVTEPLDG